MYIAPQEACSIVKALFRHKVPGIVQAACLANEEDPVELAETIKVDTEQIEQIRKSSGAGGANYEDRTGRHITNLYR